MAAAAARPRPVWGHTRATMIAMINDANCHCDWCCYRDAGYRVTRAGAVVLASANLPSQVVTDTKRPLACLNCTLQAHSVPLNLNARH